MRNLILILLLAVPLLSCKKKLTQFYIDYSTQVVIPSTFGQFLPFSIYTPEVTTNSEVEFEINNTKKEYVRSIYLKEMKLTISSPSNETFSFLNKIDVFISSTNHAESRVAYKYSIPDSVGNIITCDLIDVDLQEFIKDDQIKIRVETVTDETIPQDVTVDVYSNFLVDAKLRK